MHCRMYATSFYEKKTLWNMHNSFGSMQMIRGVKENKLSNHPNELTLATKIQIAHRSYYADAYACLRPELLDQCCNTVS